ncbi:unnamed protein product [Ranitomeya imitator]|uniref:Cilia- and flagella-associated protein 418 n=1 Tax=Ranitomeya imitator TaxID=111125 RepID=A0ABN9LQU4_9NEOB|nr:unnamed protein product [Ranitomeya imitator]
MFPERGEVRLYSPRVGPAVVRVRWVPQVRSGASDLHSMTSSSGLHAAAAVYFVCPVEGRQDTPAQEPQREDLKRTSWNEDRRRRTGPITPNVSSPRQQSCKTSRQHPNKKCCPVYLGGSLVPFGLGTSVSERACNQLRCTSCDFSIVTFEDYKWDASCDYLFFRNSVPDHSKLQTRMVKKKGARAYACQCSWRSIQQLAHLSAEEPLRWVCGTHSD